MADTPRPLRAVRKLWLNVLEAAGLGKRGPLFQDALDQVKGRSDLWSPWLEHLLLLSMLQHASGSWTWGRYVVVYPSASPDLADMVTRYRRLLAGDATFGSITLEDVLDLRMLSARTTKAIRERYLPG